jgi:hypothetical protein
LTAAFVFFAAVLLRHSVIVGARDDSIRSVTATAAGAGTLMIVVLMMLDPHLTVRGSADLFFPLVALSVIRPARTANAHESHRAATLSDP